MEHKPPSALTSEMNGRYENDGEEFKMNREVLALFKYKCTYKTAHAKPYPTLPPCISVLYDSRGFVSAVRPCMIDGEDT